MGKIGSDTNDTINYDVEVLRIYAHKGGNISFDAKVNGVSIYGMAMIWMPEKEDYFISFPSKKGKDNKYYNYVYFKVTDEIYKDIYSQVEKLSGEGE